MVFRKMKHSWTHRLCAIVSAKYKRDGLWGLVSATAQEPYHFTKFCFRYCGETDADAAKILQVNPNSIKYINGKHLALETHTSWHIDSFPRRKYFAKYVYLGEVVAGEWDLDVIPFWACLEYQMIAERHGLGLDWQIRKHIV